MKAVAFFIAFLFFLVIPKSAFAVISITNVSSSVINSVDDVISITASASGLSSSTQYLQVLFTKDGDVTNYFGLTQNLSGEWYKYKSSPSLTSDLQVYFYSFTPVGGAWTGTISAKLDIDDSGFKGVGNYDVKLAKYITSSSPTYSSNQATVSANVTPIPTQTPAPTSTIAQTPTPTKTPTPTFIPVTVSLASETADILGESTESATLSGEATTPIFQKSEAPNKKTEFLGENNFTKIMISAGIIFMSACGILIFRAYRKGKNEIKNLQ